MDFRSYFSNLKCHIIIQNKSIKLFEWSFKLILENWRLGRVLWRSEMGYVNLLHVLGEGS